MNKKNHSLNLIVCKVNNKIEYHVKLFQENKLNKLEIKVRSLEEVLKSLAESRFLLLT